MLTGLAILACITLIWLFRLRGFGIHAPRVIWAVVVGLVLLFCGLIL